MCGIAGLVLTSTSPDLARRAALMAQSLYHRGPDDGGLVTFGPVNSAAAAVLGRPDDDRPVPVGPAYAALAARRLAILDLSPRGHMPMPSRDRLAWIVHNGEIYNYLELREILAADGCAFDTGTDTEVILAAWQAWGADCFDRFDGMWAVAIYEPDARRLVLARDPFGIKPLYWALFPGGFAFASEIKALFGLPEVARRVHPPTLVDFIDRGLIDHTDDTLFDGVRSLSGGKVLTVSLAPAGELSMSFREMADIARPARPRDVHAESLLAAFDRSIVLHLRSDVPVGSCLSGGIDSSAIVATVARLRSGQESQHTFTATLPGDALDESRYADALLSSCRGVQSHRVTPTAEAMLDQLDALLWHQEAPFGSPSIYLQWEVMKLARAAGMTVLLDGQGADELFCGYPGYLPTYLAQLIRGGRLVEAARLSRMPAVRHHFTVAALLGHAAAHLAPATQREKLRSLARPLRVDCVHSDLRAASQAGERDGARLDSSAARPVRPRQQDPGFAAEWRRILFRTSLPSLLHFEDRNSMAHSIEARVPFLCREIAAIAASLPPDAMLAGGRTKAVLRQSLRGRVPEAILDRTDKIGFAAPTPVWMAGPLLAWWRDLLGSPAFRQRRWIRPAAVKSATAGLDRGDPRAALTVWRCAIVEAWARRWRL